MRRAAGAFPASLQPLASSLYRDQIVHDAIEGIEAERGGDRRPEVRVGVDVVEHAAAVRCFEVLDATDVQTRRADDARGGIDGVCRNLG
jgi:hypothetical protein